MAATGGLSGRWQLPATGFMKGAALSTRVGFQVAPQPLVSNEQFGLGGVDSVRGYLEAEALVDSGMTLNAEFEAPPLSFNWSSFTSSLTGLVFADAGIGKIERPLPSVNDALAQTSSLGAGLKLMTTKLGEAQLYWALPLRDGERTFAGDSRWLFTVQTSF
jgi:hemolysin activation/secretion protein